MVLVPVIELKGKMVGRDLRGTTIYQQCLYLAEYWCS